MNRIDKLKEEVLEANLELVKNGLVTLTWGNVSGIDREEDIVIIKPSGVPYAKLKAHDMVVVNLKGELVQGDLNPSSDLKTHLELYRNFKKIGGVSHSHSTYATCFAQANKEIPALGTTHADHFFGPVPVTRMLTSEETADDYELNTGKIIVEAFKYRNPEELPGILVNGHAPFTWGANAGDAVNNSIILERVAEMAYKTKILNPEVEEIPEYIQNKHYQRKHGKDAYYGQNKKHL